MKKNFFLIIGLIFFSILSYAEQKIKPEVVKEKINALLAQFGENLNIGILVQDASSGKVLYKKNTDRYFMPASNQKLFTAFAALQSLGPDFSYSTQLFADYKKVKKDSLNDNLYLHFSGDPTLTVSQFEQLINSLAEADIRHIKGKVIIDDTAFDQMVRSPGTSWDDQDFCWGSPISSLIINHNCLNLTAAPTDLGQAAKLELPTYPQPLTLVNQIITKAKTEKDCVIKVQRWDPKTYVLSGCIKVDSTPQLLSLAIQNPRENLQVLLSYLFKKAHITVAGTFDFKKMTPNSKPFARQDSAPLKTLISIMLKESDNTIANALFKTMGANFAHEAGSFNNGSAAVRDILSRSLALSLPATTIIDGSGGSTYNFLQPEQVVTLLQKIFLSPLGPEFKNYLAIAGVDGTLKDRLKTPTTLRKIFAKTGSLTAVASLSGYLETKHKQTLIFSIMINGFTNPASKYWSLIDKICQLLVEIG